MKAAIVAAAIVQGAVAVANGPGNGNFGPGNGNGFGGFGNGGGWGGFGPGGFGMGAGKCAASCFSSHFVTATPTPQAFCTSAPELKDCVQSACTTDAAALSTYSSVSSSVCSAFTACDNKSTFTYSGGWWGSKTGDAAVTVTGCPVDGWWGPGGAWGGMGPGWAYRTDTTTLTRTLASGGKTVVTVGPATVAQAVSGSSTLLTTFTGNFAAQETGGSTGAAAGGPDANRGVKVAGACLGAVVAVVGLM